MKRVYSSKSLINPKQAVEMFIKSLGIKYETEYRFHTKRMWRFDWAIPSIKVSVEYEGLNFITGGPSGHQTIKGVSAGNEKYSEAAIGGWCVIYVNAISVRSGLAFNLIQRAVNSRNIPTK